MWFTPTQFQRARGAALKSLDRGAQTGRADGKALLRVDAAEGSFAQETPQRAGRYVQRSSSGFNPGGSIQSSTTELHVRTAVPSGGRTTLVRAPQRRWKSDTEISDLATVEDHPPIRACETVSRQVGIRDTQRAMLLLGKHGVTRDRARVCGPQNGWLFCYFASWQSSVRTVGRKAFLLAVSLRLSFLFL